MRYSIESSKSFAEVVFDLEPVIQRLGFVTLHSCDLGETLRQKGSELDEEAGIFDVINFRLAEKLLQRDISLILTLPWRIAINTDNGATRISILRPAGLLPALSQTAGIAALAAEIETRLIQIVDEVR